MILSMSNLLIRYKRQTSYNFHDQLDPAIKVGTKEDHYDSYCSHIEEMRQSNKIITEPVGGFILL